MRKSLIKRLCLFAPVLYLSLTLVSCDTTRKIKYFQDIPDSGKTKTFPKAEYTSLIIHPGDILNVNVQVIDNSSSSSAINSFNSAPPGNSPTSSLSGGSAASLLSSIAGGNTPSQQSGSQYPVRADGNVDIPILGKVKAAGYSLSQVRDMVYAEATKYFKEPIVDVRFANFKVNITGEVLKPGQYIMTDQKTSIFDALAMAGDLTVFGKRENVLLLRENEDGTKTAYRINLKKSDILSSPLYYLHQNDLIYVEPRKAKSDATDASQAKWFGIVGAIMSVLIITATRVK
jgi:polysaccharide export outer membrane protein